MNLLHFAPEAKTYSPRITITPLPTKVVPR